MVLFILFPRIPGPLWSLPNLASGATTGLSDSMYPGSVNQLSDSTEIVFRIDFKQAIPGASKLYWRGPVLSETDGFVWKQKKWVQQARFQKETISSQFLNRVSKVDQLISYTITLEPQKQKWLFALEMGESFSSQFINNVYLSDDLQFLAQQVITQVVQYQVTSYTDFVLKAKNDKELQQALLFPKQSNPKTLQMGRQWRKNAQQTGNDSQFIVNQALAYYVQQNFYYSKQPALMSKDPADQFLFQYRRGFCEHFASSFVLLMRAANIPARVVTGYQGMEYNKLGDYYLVRQSNAHAWAEVWIDKKGWVRVDPTAVIPQDHIEKDVFNYKTNELGFLNLNYSDLAKLAQTLKQQSWAIEIVQQLKQSYDLLQYSWNNWVLGYDKNKQQSFLALLGLTNHWQTMLLLMTFIPLAILSIFFYFQLLKQQKNKDKLLAHYHNFLEKLKRQGFSYRAHDGPEKLKQRSLKLFPEQLQQLEKIFNYYIQLRYGKKNKAYCINDFKKLINNLKIQ